MRGLSGDQGGLTNGRLAAFLTALAASAVLGAVAGLIWAAVAPTPVLQEIAPGEAQLANAESSAFIVADAWFALITVVCGLLTGVLGYRFLGRRGGPAAVAGLILGAAAGAAAAMGVGEAVGTGSYEHLLAASATGTLFHASLALGAKSALALWPLCTAVVILIAESGKGKEDRPEITDDASSEMWTGEPPEPHAP